MSVYQELLEKKSSGLVFKPMITPKLDVEALGAPGEITSLGRIEAILNSPLKDSIYYQGNILSCVHATIAFLNAYNSWFNDKNPVHLSWLYTYGQVRHYPGGTSADESLNFLCSKGQPQDKTFPSRLAIEKGEQWAQRPPIPQEAHDEAPNWQSLKHLKFGGDRMSLYTTLVQTPVGIGLNVGDGWSNPKGKIVASNLKFGHMNAMVDVLDEKNIAIVKDFTGYSLSEADYGSWILVNWWEEKKLQIIILDKNYPIFWGRVLVDKTDTLFVEKKDKKTLKLIKADGPEIYLLDFSNRLHWITNESSYERFIDADKNWEWVEVVSQEVLEGYQMGDPANVIWNNISDAIKFYTKHKLLNFE